MTSSRDDERRLAAELGPRLAPGQSRRDALGELAISMSREEILEVALHMADELDRVEKSAGRLIRSLYRFGNVIMNDRHAQYDLLAASTKILRGLAALPRRTRAATLQDLIANLKEREKALGKEEPTTAWPGEIESLMALPWIQDSAEVER